MKKLGDAGQPCLTPRFRSNTGPIDLFTFNLAFASKYKLSTLLNIDGERNRFNTRPNNPTVKCNPLMYSTHHRIQRLLAQDPPRIKPACIHVTYSLTRSLTDVNKQIGLVKSTESAFVFFGIGTMLRMRSIGGSSQQNVHMRTIMVKLSVEVLNRLALNILVQHRHAQPFGFR